MGIEWLKFLWSVGRRLGWGALAREICLKRGIGAGYLMMQNPDKRLGEHTKGRGREAARWLAAGLHRIET
jgi:hypothetical protein